MTIQENYELQCATPSDINEHLSVIHKYAKECETFCELGVRSVVSTWAILAAKPKKVISVDIDWHPNVLECYKQTIKEGLVWEFVLGNDLEYEMPEVDGCLCDSFHTYTQCSNELRLHGNKVKKYWLFHDTTSFFQNGENSYTAVEHTGQNCGRGIWAAIEEFMQVNPHWVLEERLYNNNGFTVLKRKY